MYIEINKYIAGSNNVILSKFYNRFKKIGEIKIFYKY